jgi:membrane protein DedA with SNARE-associated domain
VTVAQRLLELVAGLGGPLLALAATLFAFSEAAVGFDILVPGELGLAIVGAAAGRTGLPLPVVLGCAIVGGIAGDSTSYWLGRKVGTEVVCRWRWTRRRLGPTVGRAQEHFERRGGLSVFIGRWIGALRAVVPVVAGAARMPYLKFLAWDVPGVVSWTTAVVVLGYRLGEPAAELIDRYGTYLSVGAVTAIAAFLAYRHFRKDDRPKPVNICDCDDGSSAREERTQEAHH